MLHHGNKIGYLSILILLLLFASCNKFKKFDAKEIETIRFNSQNYSQSIIGDHNYWQLYSQMNDTIRSWVNHGIGNYVYWDTLINYQIDSVFCINNAKDKIIASVMLPYIGEGGNSDDIIYFYGVKIYGQWYFFIGPAMVLPRERYQQDIHSPLSFDKLKQIATWHIYRHYLKPNQQGEWVINEQFFASLDNYDAYNFRFTTQESWDESWLKLAGENWQKARK